ncbi:hypothetical protein Ddc_09739 [Ditylenchus destructor]|nr:hypothetical protein Ddc_09739 [Ditylenchus destructor]
MSWPRPYLEVPGFESALNEDYCPLQAIHHRVSLLLNHSYKHGFLIRRTNEPGRGNSTLRVPTTQLQEQPKHLACCVFCVLHFVGWLLHCPLLECGSRECGQ